MCPCGCGFDSVVATLIRLRLFILTNKRFDEKKVKCIVGFCDQNLFHLLIRYLHNGKLNTVVCLQVWYCTIYALQIGYLLATSCT